MGMLYMIFREFDILRKKFSIIFDYASNNTSVIDLFVRTIRRGPLSEIFHMRCVYHIINLIVQDGLKLTSLSLESIQFAIQFIYPPNKLQKFNALCKTIDLKKRKFHYDIGF